MTTDDTEKPVFWWLNTYLRKTSTCKEFGIFYREIGNSRRQSTVTDGGLNLINPAPHIHEHLRYTIMATALRTPSRKTTSRLSTLR